MGTAREAGMRPPRKPTAAAAAARLTEQMPKRVADEQLLARMQQQTASLQFEEILNSFKRNLLKLHFLCFKIIATVIYFVVVGSNIVFQYFQKPVITLKSITYKNN